MPSGIPNGSAKAVDHAINQLAKAIREYVDAEANKPTPHMIPEQVLRKRLFLAIRNADILPRRRAISDDDNFAGLLDPMSFSASCGMFEPWLNNIKSTNSPVLDTASIVDPNQSADAVQPPTEQAQAQAS